MAPFVKFAGGILVQAIVVRGIYGYVEDAIRWKKKRDGHL